MYPNEPWVNAAAPPARANPLNPKSPIILARLIRATVLRDILFGTFFYVPLSIRTAPTRVQSHQICPKLVNLTGHGILRRVCRTEPSVIKLACNALLLKMSDGSLDTSGASAGSLDNRFTNHSWLLKVSCAMPLIKLLLKTEASYWPQYYWYTWFYSDTGYQQQSIKNVKSK